MFYPPSDVLHPAYTRFVTDSPTLTSLAKAGGCAAKYPAARLEKLLAGFVPVDAADLLVGLDPADDAAVYRLDDDRALVFTVDFFPPVVDDPRDFGAIAATNALNDVFAMGGVPLLALSITAFPEELPTEMLGEILAGADEVVRAAGAILAGGHTIRDDEPKYGLAVVGTVHPDGIWPKSGARPGDALFLTKPLGTGLVLQAQREGRAPDGCARRGRGGDAHAQPRRGRCAAAVRAERGHRRDRLRPARPRVRDGVAQRRAHRARRRGAPRAARARSSWPRPGSGRAATAATATTPGRTSRATRRRRAGGARLRPADGGRPARLAPGRQGAPCSRPTFAARGLPLYRVGRVEAGDGRRRYGERAVVSRHVEGCAPGASRRTPRGLARAVSARSRSAPSIALFFVVTTGAVRPPHRLGARLRPLAALRHDAVPDEGRRTRSSSSATAWSRSSGSARARRPGSPRAQVAALCRAGRAGSRARRAPRHASPRSRSAAHDPPRPAPARRDVALPARARRARRSPSSSRSRPGAAPRGRAEPRRPALAPASSRWAGLAARRGPRRHRRRRDRVGAASGRREGHRAARRRDRRHRLRPRAGRRGFGIGFLVARPLRSGALRDAARACSRLGRRCSSSSSRR